MTRRGAFTLIELLIVIIIIGVLSGILLLVMGPGRDRAKLAECQQDQMTVGSAARLYVSDNSGQHPELQDLVDAGYIDRLPECIGEGTCTWSSEELKLTCGGGSAPVPEPLTPLGSTFQEISGEMGARVLQYYQDNGTPLSTWKDERYEDIGLDIAFWENPVEGILYAPGGLYVKIRPTEPGIRFQVTTVTGETKTLTSALNWNIWYNVATDTWYYHNNTDPNSVFDPHTLVIIRD